MKKLVIVICTLLCANVLFAQENVKKEKDLAVVVDSLAVKLNKLQKDYDYLWCEYKLNEINSGLNDDENEISTKSNQLLTNIYHGRFNYDLYNSYKEYYNSKIYLLENYKINAESIRNLVTLKMITSNFSENEIRVLQHLLKILDSAINSVESSLKLYDSYIEIYRKKSH